MILMEVFIPVGQILKGMGASMTKLFSYVVTRDYGFAPNPFHSYCTLATCKPQIRKHANVGDWVVGTTSVAIGSRHGSKPMLLYWMKVSEILTFQQYWSDTRFQVKKPMLNGSKKMAYGDNIYHQTSYGVWMQSNSHHTYPDGSINRENLSTDTGQTNNVLISNEFVYMGENPLPIPPSVANHQGVALAKKGAGHKSSAFNASFISNFENWHYNFYCLGNAPMGFQNKPSDW